MSNATAELLLYSVICAVVLAVPVAIVVTLFLSMWWLMFVKLAKKLSLAESFGHFAAEVVKGYRRNIENSRNEMPTSNPAD